jgi:hypothetical protein
MTGMSKRRIALKIENGEEDLSPLCVLRLTRTAVQIGLSMLKSILYLFYISHFYLGLCGCRANEERCQGLQTTTN